MIEMSDAINNHAVNRQSDDQKKTIIDDLDDALKYIGEFGRYQLIIITMLGLVTLSAAFPVLIMYFAAQNPPWTCQNNSTICNITGNISPSNPKYEMRCSMPRDAWRFTQPKEYSIVTQFDIYCGNDYFISLTSSLLFVGWGLGSFVYGWLADSYGRVKSLFLSMAAVIILSFISAFSPNIIVFTCFRFAIGFFYPATMVGPCVIKGELLGPKYRPIAAAYTGIMFAIGLFLTGLKAYFVRKWKTLLIICSAPYACVLLFYWFIPESFRWLRLHDKHADVIRILQKAATVNKKRLPDGLEIAPLPKGKLLEQRSNILDIFRPLKMLIFTSLQGYAWLATAAVYYGISLGVGSLTGEMYRDYVLATLVEIPAVISAVFLLRKPGRRLTVSIGLLLSGIFCIVIGVLSKLDTKEAKWKYTRLAFGLLGKYFISIVFSAIYTWSVELYPTSIRGEGMGFLQITARVGSAIAPWIAKWLGGFDVAIPFSLMGALALAASPICLGLSETRDCSTRETTDQVLGSSTGGSKNVLVTENDTVMAN